MDTTLFTVQGKNYLTDNILYFENCLSSLEDQIHLLKDNFYKDIIFEGKYHNTVCRYCIYNMFFLGKKLYVDYIKIDKNGQSFGSPEICQFSYFVKKLV